MPSSPYFAQKPDIMTNNQTNYYSIRWSGALIEIIDQTKLPEEELYITLQSAEETWDAISKLKVRGAPAIGIAGAYGFYLGIKDGSETDYSSFLTHAEKVATYLNSSRPTAVNLNWALQRLLAEIRQNPDKSPADLKNRVLKKAIEIHIEDRELCKSIGEHGVSLVPDDARILTHCNTGGLATAAYGTAFSVILHSHFAKKVKMVWVDETRPLNQGSRLTAWELKKAGVPFTLNTDSAAASLMRMGNVDLIITGADRITLNGDTANKIGTYSLAVLAKAHNIPFYIAAPYSTIDLEMETGEEIEIEQRSPLEVTHFGNRQTAPDDIQVYNPAFDVTPNHLITGIITEKGIVKPDFRKNIPRLFS